MKPKLELNLIATTYGGPERYHPAIRNLEHDIWYWPNVTQETEQLAHIWAAEAIGRLTSDLLNKMQQTIDEWNIFQV